MYSGGEMSELLKIIPVALYFIVGVICLAMAFKTLRSDKFLPFHEKASGKPWNELDEPLKVVILSFMRLSGLGFLVVAILLMVCPIVNYFAPSAPYEYLIPSVALIYCAGLFVNNYILYKRTGADAPWKGSIYAMAVIIAGIVVTVLIG